MQERIHRTPVQEIVLERFEREGLILDIGGGSEAIVSRLEGKRVCAVDIKLTKIREGKIYTSAGHWILADGRSLCFDSSAFEIATLWFSLAYIREETYKKRVIEEAFRILKRNGTVSILGCSIPGDQAVFEFRGIFRLPDAFDTKITYRVRGDQKQSLKSIMNYTERAGFSTESSVEHGHWFKLICTKK